VRVVIADDSILVREGIAALLGRAGIDVVAQGSSADELSAKSTGTARTWPSSTSGCRRPSPTKGGERRTRSARATQAWGS
jgi:hypothetical protein